MAPEESATRPGGKPRRIGGDEGSRPSGLGLCCHEGLINWRVILPCRNFDPPFPLSSLLASSDKGTVFSPLLGREGHGRLVGNQDGGNRGPRHRGPHFFPSSGKRVGDFGPFLNHCLLLLLRCGHVGNALALSIMSIATKFVFSRVFVMDLDRPTWLDREHHERWIRSGSRYRAGNMQARTLRRRYSSSRKP
jgi:hypothetical protein